MKRNPHTLSILTVLFALPLCINAAEKERRISMDEYRDKMKAG